MEIYKLQLSRTDNVAEVQNSNNSIQKDNLNTFCMFDYFDFMTVIKPKSYDINKLLENNNNGEEKSHNSAKQDIYLYKSENTERKEKSSKILDGDNKNPYILMIQISLSEYFYRYIKSEEIETGLNKLENKIKSIIKEIDNDCKCDVLKLLSAGDIIVIVRSSNVNKFHLIVDAIAKIHIKAKQKKENHLIKEKMLLFITYSVIGVEKKHFKFNKDDYKQEIAADSKIVLRMAFSDKLKKSQEITNKIYELFCEPLPYRTTGFYDISIRLEPEDFFKVFPEIIKYKTKNCRYSKKIKISDKTYDKIEFLKDLIKYGYFYSINERILAKNSYNDIFKNDTSFEFSIDGRDLILESCLFENAQKRIVNLCENVILLTKEFEKSKLLTENQQLKSNQKEIQRIIVQINASIHSQNNLYFNSVIAIELLEVLYASTKRYKTLFDNNEITLFELLESINMGISKVGKFINQMYILNYNNYETPTYTMNLASSVEKITVAYGELLRSQGKKFMDYVSGEDKDYSYNILVPFVLPDNEALFPSLYPIFNDIKNAEKTNADVDRKRLLNVISPSYELLTKPNDLIPLFLHEIGHFVPFLNRQARNNVFTKFELYFLCKALVSDLTNFYVVNDLSKELNAFIRKSFYYVILNIIGNENTIFAKFSSNLEFALSCCFEKRSSDNLNEIVKILQQCYDYLNLHYGNSTNHYENLTNKINECITSINCINTKIENIPLIKLYDENFDSCLKEFFKKFKEIALELEKIYEGILKDLFEEAKNGALGFLNNIDITLDENSIFDTINSNEKFNELESALLNKKASLDRKESEKLDIFINTKFSYIKNFYFTALDILSTFAPYGQTYSNTDDNNIIYYTSIQNKIQKHIYCECYNGLCNYKINSQYTKIKPTYYNLLNELGLIDPKIKKYNGFKRFSKKVDELMNRNTLKNIFTNRFEIIENLFRESIADIIMIKCYNMTLAEYETLCNNYFTIDPYNTFYENQYNDRKFIVTTLAEKLEIGGINPWKDEKWFNELASEYDDLEMTEILNEFCESLNYIKEIKHVYDFSIKEKHDIEFISKFYHLSHKRICDEIKEDY